ncbi:hypothetical protein D9Q98_008265 [Chlorella vulgaris]|uniref:protein-tyrosine-phosphatase n=1 Tax=Chlorella vulgaris TaxID=3077 RepID=A0A9D4YSX0_CHLVU|nr:hypothetical protein D9Q98_008265 [Chlorella vulgaris]
MTDQQEQRKRQRRSLDDGVAQQPSSGGTGGAGAVAAPNPIVLVWDLDETLLVFNSLLIGTWAVATQNPAAADDLRKLGQRWEAAILALCDDHFFFDQVEEWDQCCLADIQPHDDCASLTGYNFSRDGFPPATSHKGPASSDKQQQHASGLRPSASSASQAPWVPPTAGGSPVTDGAMGDAHGQMPSGPRLASPHGSPACASLDAAMLAKLAYRYRRIAKLVSFGLHALGTGPQRDEWEALYQETDAVTGGWLRHASALLADCSRQLCDSSAEDREVVHVAVTSGQLVPSLAKLLLFKLGAHIAPTNVWSSRHCGKAACFDLVRRRFGPACTYVAIGDGMEEDEAAAEIGWPYIRVLLAPAANYPAQRVLTWRPEAATCGPGLPFTQLTIGHIARAAGLPPRQRSADSFEVAHGSSAAAAALSEPSAMAIEAS